MPGESISVDRHRQPTHYHPSRTNYHTAKPHKSIQLIRIKITRTCPPYLLMPTKALTPLPSSHNVLPPSREKSLHHNSIRSHAQKPDFIPVLEPHFVGKNSSRRPCSSIRKTRFGGCEYCTNNDLQETHHIIIMVCRNTPHLLANAFRCH
jgi:hypothetical protein